MAMIFPTVAPEPKLTSENPLSLINMAVGEVPILDPELIWNTVATPPVFQLYVCTAGTPLIDLVYLTWPEHRVVLTAVNPKNPGSVPAGNPITPTADIAALAYGKLFQ
jgi:hypothetical protein